MLLILSVPVEMAAFTSIFSTLSAFAKFAAGCRIKEMKGQLVSKRREREKRKGEEEKRRRRREEEKRKKEAISSLFVLVQAI